MASTDHLKIYLDDEGIDLLRSFRFPCLEHLFERDNKLTDLGFEIAVSFHELDSLAGWVAGEANYHRKKRSRHTALLDDIADQIEDVLAVAPRPH